MNSMTGEPQRRARTGRDAWDGPREGGDLPPVDLMAFARTLWRGRWLVAGCCAAAVALALLVIARIEPAFTAGSQILLLADQPEARSAEPGDTGALDDQRLETEIEIIYSAAVLGAVVDAVALTSDPAVVGAAAAAPSRFEATRERVSDALPERLAAVLDRLLAPAAPEAPALSPRILAIEHLRENLSVQRIRESRVMNLFYTADDPERAARIANAVARAYIADRTAARRRTQERDLEWLNERVARLRGEIQSSEDAVEARRAELLMEAGQGLEITRRDLDARAGELADTRSEAARLALLQERLSAALEDEDAGLLSAEFRDAEPIRDLRQEERTLLARLGDLGEGNAARPVLEAELASARDEIRAEAERIVLGVGEDLRAARAREAQLAQAVRALEDRALRQTRAELDLRQLELNVEAGRRNYEEVMQQLFRAGGRPAVERADIRILSRAEPPARPDGRREQIIVLMALVTGGLLGLGAVILRDQMNAAFRSARELEDLTGLPVLGSIPKVRAGRGRGGVVAYSRRKPHSTLAEAVRSLCVGVAGPEGGSSPRVVALTAPSVDEGKSTTAVLMAIGFQRSGRRAVVVDCDLRRPRVAALLGKPPSGPGLWSVMGGWHTLEEAVRTSSADGPAVLPAGSDTAPGYGDRDALASDRFAEVVEALRRRYDVVVLNAPPVLMTADARIIARAADAVLLVVRWNRTPREAAAEAVSSLEAAGAPLRGAVLSVVDERRAYEALRGVRRRRRVRRLGYFRN